MKETAPSLTYLLFSLVIFGCMATELGTRDYNATGITTKVVMVGIIALCGAMVFDAVKEFHKTRK